MDEPRAIPVLIMRPGAPDERAVVRLPDQADARYFGALKHKVEAITGGPMEHVRVYTDFEGGLDFRYLDMFVHECGQLLGMSRNDKATRIYRNNVMVNAIPTPSEHELPDIVGPAILFAEKVWF